MSYMDLSVCVFFVCGEIIIKGRDALSMKTLQVHDIQTHKRLIP